MPPKFLIEPGRIEADNVIAGAEQIRSCNPQRFEFEQLDRIVFFDPAQNLIAGVKDIGGDEFWVRGHIPGRPLFPGVLMCESAAQLCCYYYKKVTGYEGFLGFGGLDSVKFRGQVVPGDSFIAVAKNLQLSQRRAVFECQGIVKGKLVFQGRVTGMPI